MCMYHRYMHTTFYVISWVVAAVLFVSGAIKLSGIEQTVKMREHLRIEDDFWVLAGALEMLALPGVAFGVLLSELLMIVVLIGACALTGIAVVIHLDVEDGPRAYAPSSLMVVLSAMGIWAGVLA